jgi:hypothetical protein
MASAPDPQLQGLDSSLLLMSFTVFSISVEQHGEEQDYMKTTANRHNLDLDLFLLLKSFGISISHNL